MREFFGGFGLSYVTIVGTLLTAGFILIGSSIVSFLVRDNFTLPKERYLRSGFHFTSEILVCFAGIFCLAAAVVLLIPEWIEATWRVMNEFFNSIHF